MPRVERIEDWRGQEVVDAGGEKLGKLSEVFFRTGTDEAVFGTVNHGFLGRKAAFVSLAGATLSRDYVRVAHDKAAVDAAPVSGDDEVLSPESARALAEHYRVELPPGESSGLEGARARDDRLARAAEERARAEELHDASERKAAEAREARLQAEELAEQARQADRDARADRRAATDAEDAAIEAERGPGVG